MFLSKDDFNKLNEYVDGLYWDTDRMSRDGRYFLNKLDNHLKNISKNKNEIYVITNNAVVDDEIFYSIAGVATNIDDAKQILKDTVRDMKCDSDFDNLDAIKLTDDIDQSKLDEVWVYGEDEYGFNLYLNCNYNSNNYSAQIERFDLNKNLEKEDSMEI